MGITEMERSPRGRPARRAAPSSTELAERLGKLASETQAQDVVVVDLRGISSACDYFVIASGLSEPHLAALANHLEDAVKEAGVRPWHVEGRQNRKWILMDFVDVVVHLFLADTREYYRLETLWSEAPRTEIRPGGSDAPESPGAGPEES